MLAETAFRGPLENDASGFDAVVVPTRASPPIPLESPAMPEDGAQVRHDKVGAGRLLLAFLRLGLTAFGGPAMVAYIRELAVRRKGWVPADTFQRGVALCQSIPGATAMQVAAYTGLRAGGPLGAVAAFVGFGLPAFVLMVALAAGYQATHSIAPVMAAFRGLQAVVVALVANAAVSFGRSGIKGWREGFLAAAAAAFLAAGGSPFLAIPGAAVAGCLLLPRVPERPRQIASSLGMGHLRPALVVAAGFAACLVVLALADCRLFDLAVLMARIDLFAFGGGYASVPIMLHEIVVARHWMDAKTFMDGIALGQATPGPIVITATFVGYQLAGLAGAIVATVAVFSPSLIILLGAVPFLDRLQGSETVQRALQGILASFVGLLFAVGLRFALAAAWQPLSAALALAAFTALRAKVDVLWVVIAGAVLGALLL